MTHFLWRAIGWAEEKPRAEPVPRDGSRATHTHPHSSACSGTLSGTHLWLAYVLPAYTYALAQVGGYLPMHRLMKKQNLS